MKRRTRWKGSYGHDAGRAIRSRAAAEKKRPAWVVGGATIVSFVALLYVIELFDPLSATGWTRTASGRWRPTACGASSFAPLLHANWDHLIANTMPALVLGFLMTLAGMARFICATAIVWILGGFGTWLIGNIGAHCPYVGVHCESNHIGASGLIFGWLAFLIVFGFFTRTVWEIVVGVVVLFVYGGVLLGVLPGHPGGVVAGPPVRRDRGVSSPPICCPGRSERRASYASAGPALARRLRTVAMYTGPAFAE